MTNIEILACEKRDSEDDLYKIHLFLENDWWRAYEWSAYLCHKFPNNLKEIDRLKVTRKKSSLLSDGITLVGFKEVSFEKYLPSVELPKNHNGHVILDVRKYFNLDNVTIDTVQNILLEWKNLMPLKTKESKKKQIANIETEITANAEISNIKNDIPLIFKEILNYPLENKTLLDNIIFIRHLKNEILAAL